MDSFLLVLFLFFCLADICPLTSYYRTTLCVRNILLDMACLFPQVNPSRLTKFCHQYRLKVKSIVADWYWYCQEFIQLLYLNISVHILHTFFYTFLKVLTILAAIIDMWTFCWRAPEERTMIEQWLFYTSWSRPQMGGLPIWLPLMLFRVVTACVESNPLQVP